MDAELFFFRTRYENRFHETPRRHAACACRSRSAPPGRGADNGGRPSVLHRKMETQVLRAGAQGLETRIYRPLLCRLRHRRALRHGGIRLDERRTLGAALWKGNTYIDHVPGHYDTVFAGLYTQVFPSREEGHRSILQRPDHRRRVHV